MDSWVVSLLIPIVAFSLSLFALWRAWEDHARVKSELDTLRSRISYMQRVLQWRGELANEIAHEIKNPLTAILCSAETLDLLLGNKIAAEHRESLKYIREYGGDLLRLVSDFMDVSRAESGHIGCVPEEVLLHSVASSVIGLLKASALKKNIEVTLSMTEPKLQAFVDARHFKQILFNLLHNALKFTPQDGKVLVSIQFEEQQNCVTLLVQDNGPGIPSDKLRNLFNLYGQDGGMANSCEVGTRLGLSLCKTLVQLNGGHIAVDSWLGVGTAFCVVIPAVQPQAESIVEATPSLKTEVQPHQPLCGQTFLLVEEDQGVRDSLSALIRAWGGIVDGVGEATAAVKALESQTYDAVMIDGDIKPNESQDLIKKIRDGLSSNETTIILAGDPQSESGTNTGPDKYVAKPLNGELLLKSLINSGKFQVTH